MDTRRASPLSRKLSLKVLATLCASAAPFTALPAAAAQNQSRFDPYTQGAATDKADPYTQGGATDKADPYTQGGDRQADTYGYLAWKYDRFDPYVQGADRQASAHDVLAWRGDASYPSDAQGHRA